MPSRPSPRRPKPTPRTLYDIWAAVYQRIKEEPRRYFQGWWVLRAGDVRARGLEMPPCGPAACRLGWFAYEYLGRTPSDMEAQTEAQQLHRSCSDMLQYDLNMLSRAHACDWPSGLGRTGERSPRSPKPGSREYHRRGLRGLRTFMRKYKKELKAVVVPEPINANPA